MVVPNPQRATIDDLYSVEGKAELIAGRFVHLISAGRLHNRIAKRIVKSLDDYAELAGVGEAFADNLGYALRPPLPNGRESLSPDVSYHARPFPADVRKFIDGGPTFAAEVRSPDEYGPAAEADIADKRADYFLAGTAVVWDVDPDARTVTKFRAGDPGHATVFGVGDDADAEPAVPGWRLNVATLFV